MSHGNHAVAAVQSTIFSPGKTTNCSRHGGGKEHEDDSQLYEI